MINKHKPTITMYENLKKHLNCIDYYRNFTKIYPNPSEIYFPSVVVNDDKLEQIIHEVEEKLEEK